MIGVIGGFFLRSLSWLVVTLAIWFWLREGFVAPVAWLAERSMLLFFPEWVVGTELNGIRQTLLTNIVTRREVGAVIELAPVANVLSYAFGYPMFVALVLAARARGVWWKLPLGFVLLLPFQAWGVCFDWLVTVAVKSGGLSAAYTGFTMVHVNAFSLAYQLGYLILPTLLPIILLLVLERRFVATIMVEVTMAEALKRRG